MQSFAYKFGPPNWPEWLMMDQVTFLEAACLAADLVPTQVPFSHFWYEGQLSRFPDKVQLIWHVMDRDAAFEKFEYLDPSGRMFHRVPLGWFARWAVEKGIEVPGALRNEADKYVAGLAPPLRREASESKSEIKALPRERAHELKILQEIKKQGFNALAFPMNAPGKPGAKKQVREALPLLSKDVFDGAWERLRKSGEIKNS